MTVFDSQKRCQVCGGGLPDVSVLMRDPFCSRACSQEHHGTGSRADRERDSRRRLDRQLESGTDAASMELRRVTVDERTALIAEGRFWEEYLRAYGAYLVAHKPPATTPTVTWFSYRSSRPTMREFDPEDENFRRTMSIFPPVTDSIHKARSRAPSSLSNSVTSNDAVGTSAEAGT